jgi:hypothetical protein
MKYFKFSYLLFKHFIANILQLKIITTIDLNPKPWSIVYQPTTINRQLSTINQQPSTKLTSQTINL